jgi:hypothetical protein
MRDLNSQFKQLCAPSRDGGFSTRTSDEVNISISSPSGCIPTQV